MVSVGPPPPPYVAASQQLGARLLPGPLPTPSHAKHLYKSDYPLARFWDPGASPPGQANMCAVTGVGGVDFFLRTFVGDFVKDKRR